jgi:ABC-type transport system involved in multi-copper enzyme maturation permease subunit|tara:strand:+ start:7874 stop:8731 length:858 start_codon:yes stop_codon:yes gene_type:complete
MNGFMTALRSEIFVAKHTFVSKLALIFPALIVVTQNFFSWVADTGNSARNNLISGGSFDEVIASNAYGYFVDSINTGITMLALLMVCIAAHSFSYDRDSGFVRHILIRKVGRTTLILAKFVYLHLLAVTSLTVLLITAYFNTGFFWEYGPVVEDGFELISEEEIVAEILLGLRLAVIPLPAAIGFGLMTSSIAQTATQALMTALGVTLAVDIFKPSLGAYADYLYARFLPSIVDTSYLSEVSRLVRGYSDVLVDDRILQMNLLIPIPTAIIFICINLLIIKQKKL